MFLNKSKSVFPFQARGAVRVNRVEGVQRGSKAISPPQAPVPVCCAVHHRPLWPVGPMLSVQMGRVRAVTTKLSRCMLPEIFLSFHGAHECFIRKCLLSVYFSATVLTIYVFSLIFTALLKWQHPEMALSYVFPWPCVLIKYMSVRLSFLQCAPPSNVIIFSIHES